MAYQVLARKWRPKKFADIVGQEHVIRALQNALQEGRLHHAYLLTGTRGVGKTTIARILAKSFNCEHPVDGEPCGICSACVQIDAGRFVDLLEIDAASNTGIDNIREVLENAQYAPTAGHYKVYIIDEVHMLSKSAFNAMLKTLEEPPEHVKFILATTDPHKVPVTVLSRCLQFVLRNMQPGQIQQYLAHILQVEQIPFEPNALGLLAKAGMGSMRDALSLLDQAIALGSGKVQEVDVRHMLGAVDRRYLYGILLHLLNQDGETLIQEARDMAERAVGFDNALSELAALLQHLALIQAVPGILEADEPDREILIQLAEALSAEQIQLYYQCAIHGKKDLTLAPDEYAGFMMTLLRMLAFAPLAISSDGSAVAVEGTDLQDTASTPVKKKLTLNLSKPETITQNLADNLSEFGKPVVDKQEQQSSLAHSAQVSSVAESEPISLQEESIAVEDQMGDSELPDVSEAGNWDEEAQSEIEMMSPDLPWEDNESTEGEEAISVESEDDQALTTRDGEAEEDYREGLTPEELVLQGSFFEEAPSASTSVTSSHQKEEQGKPQQEVMTPAETGYAPTPEALIRLPALQPENWAEIISALAQKLGAAQMLAQHSVLISAEEGVLTLGMKAQQVLASKERLARIAQVISEAYDQSWQVETKALENGQETVHMQRVRLQSEAQQEAFENLQADPVAQQIIELFDASWLPDSIKPLN